MIYVNLSVTISISTYLQVHDLIEIQPESKNKKRYMYTNIYIQRGEKKTITMFETRQDV